MIQRFPYGAHAIFTRSLFAGLLVATAALRAGETPFLTFDTDAAGWYWEDWSAKGSSTAFDATQNSAATGLPPASGSLKLASGFTGTAEYQQAVFTLPLPAPQNFEGQVGAIRFDVKVAESSTSTASGNYGLLEVILRQGNNWDWVGLPGVVLNGTGWQRVTFSVPKAGVDSIRAATIKLSSSEFGGPVTLNIDNVAFLTNPDDVFITSADNGTADTAPEGWSWESWSVNGLVTWDPLDARGWSTSGSIKLDHDFANSPGTYQQTVFTYVLPGGQTNAAQDYSYVNLDVKVDPSSTPRAAGDYGYFEVILRNGNDWTWLSTEINGASGIRFTNTEWQHLSFKVNKSADQVHRLTFKVGENALLGPVRLLVDNITWTRNTAPPPPPTLAIGRARAGLNLVATSTDIYGRHNLYTTEPEDPNRYSFATATEPVSYSLTVTSFPDGTDHSGFQAHIFLVPGSPGTETSPDWNEPTLIFMDIKNGANGSGSATFRIKTDQAGGNSQLYAAGLTTVNSASVVGTWTLSLCCDLLNGPNVRSFTMTAPDGTVSPPIAISAEAAAQFQGPLRVYFGIQANSEANKGQSVQVGKLEIKRGSEILLSDTFSGSELDTSKWTVNASTGGVQFISPADAGYLATWTVPDGGFILQAAKTLASPSWVNVELTPVAIGSVKQVTLPPAIFGASREGYLRMVKPAAQ